MNRILYDPHFVKTHGMVFEQMLILNIIKDNKNITENEVSEKFNEVSDGWSGNASRSWRAWAYDYINISKDGIVTLSKLGKEYFDPPIEISETDYEFTHQILSLWNKHPETTSHIIKPFGEKQSKLVYKLSEILSSFKRGHIPLYMKEAVLDNERVSKIDVMEERDIIETIEDYLLTFEPNYYPVNKAYLPRSILEFFMNYKTKMSTFYQIFWKGVQEVRMTSIAQLYEFGITPNTLKKVYDALLTPEDRTSDVEKGKVCRYLTFFRADWEELVETLDKYYGWKETYQKNTRNFNAFTYDYVCWLEQNISGERFLNYLKIKEGHTIYEQFKAWYYDKFGIRLRVPKKDEKRLILKTKKYEENKNSEN